MNDWPRSHRGSLFVWTVPHDRSSKATARDGTALKGHESHESHYLDNVMVQGVGSFERSPRTVSRLFRRRISLGYQFSLCPVTSGVCTFKTGESLIKR